MLTPMNPRSTWAALDEARHHPLAEIGRDCEADALIMAVAAQNLGVDADEPAFRIDQRPAGNCPD